MGYKKFAYKFINIEFLLTRYDILNKVRANNSCGKNHIQKQNIPYRDVHHGFFQPCL